MCTQERLLHRGARFDACQLSSLEFGRKVYVLFSLQLAPTSAEFLLPVQDSSALMQLAGEAVA